MVRALVITSVMCSTFAYGQQQTARESVIFTELDAEQKAEVIETFRRETGWHESTVSAQGYAPYVHIARRQIEGELSEKPIALSAAKEFVQTHADLLGIPGFALNRLEYIHSESVLGNVIVRSKEPVPYNDGAIDTDLTFDVDLHLNVVSGKVSYLLNKTTKLGELPQLKSTPEVPAFAENIINAMVGQELTYANFAGDTVSAGVVQPTDVVPAGLTYTPLYLDEGIRVGLSWHFKVYRNFLRWDYFFDPFSGELISVRQGFAT